MKNKYQAMLECASAASEDKILVVTDTNKQAIAREFVNAMQDKADIRLIVTKPQSIDGEEPESQVAEQMKDADIIFLMTTCSMTHTKASHNAMEKGAKVLSMPNVTEESLNYIPEDTDNLVGLSEKLAEMLDKAEKALVLTDKGTKLELDLSGRKGIALHGKVKKGGIVNLPDGEALISPKSAQGTAVIDGCMSPDEDMGHGIIGKITNPIKIDIKAGRAVHVSGGKEADVLRKILNTESPNQVVAEFAIGTNQLVREMTGNVTVDEKAYGTIHIAFGNSKNIGGDNEAGVHLDGVILEPTVYLDGKLILENGKFTEPNQTGNS